MNREDNMTMASQSRTRGRAIAYDTDHPRLRLITKNRLLAASAFLVGSFILLNALMLQKDRHPAPLFQPVMKVTETLPLPPPRPESAARAAASPPATRQAALEKTRAAPPLAAPPAPASEVNAEMSEALLAEIQRELGKRGYFKGEPTGKPGATTIQAIREFQFAQRVAVDGKPSEALLEAVIASKVTMKDELLDLVRRTASEEKPDRTVLDVQRALNKAGYGPVKEDGQMGKTTRNALARFESDRKLPATGEPKGPVLKMLASASGIAIGR